MKRWLWLIVLFLFWVVALVAQNQPSSGTYRYILMGRKMLTAGTPVWANFHGGEKLHENPCTFPIMGKNPLAVDKCFEGEYLKAKIGAVQVSHDNGPRVYFYLVEFESYPQTVFDDGYRFEWNAPTDDAFKFYNLPEKWASYSEYFVRLTYTPLK